VPAKNIIKDYRENSCYHLYNRGVENRRIFEDSDDYQKFLYYIKIYLSPPDQLSKEEPLLRVNLVNGNLSENLHLIAYCLMPNHFHLLVRQKDKNAITKFMRQLTTAYSMYFNKKYSRLGPLFAGIYKASLVGSEEQIVHLSRYIHQKPRERGISVSDFPWSSYQSYIGAKEEPWLKTETVSAYFQKQNPHNNYKNFVEEKTPTSEIIKDLLLDN
jgi:putative transposase